MIAPDFVLSTNFPVVASKNNRYSCLNVSNWCFATISFCLISAIVIWTAWPMLNFDLLGMFDLSDKSICLYTDAVLHFPMT